MSPKRDMYTPKSDMYTPKSDMHTSKNSSKSTNNDTQNRRMRVSQKGYVYTQKRHLCTQKRHAYAQKRHIQQVIPASHEQWFFFFIRPKETYTASHTSKSRTMIPKRDVCMSRKRDMSTPKRDVYIPARQPSKSRTIKREIWNCLTSGLYPEDTCICPKETYILCHEQSSALHQIVGPQVRAMMPNRDVCMSRKRDMYAPKRDVYEPKRDMYLPKWGT